MASKNPTDLTPPAANAIITSATQPYLVQGNGTWNKTAGALTWNDSSGPLWFANDIFLAPGTYVSWFRLYAQPSTEGWLTLDAFGENELLNVTHYSLLSSENISLSELAAVEGWVSLPLAVIVTQQYNLGIQFRGGQEGSLIQGSLSFGGVEILPELNPVVFTITGQGNAPSVNWSVDGVTLGSSSPRSESQINLTFPTPGSYTIGASLSNSTGFVKTGSAIEVVNAFPEVTIEATPAESDINLPIHFKAVLAGGTPPFSILWIVDGLSTSMEGAVLSASFTSAAIHNVSAAATDSVGSSVRSTPVNVTVNLNPTVVEASPSMVTVLSGSTFILNLTIRYGTPPFEYNWSGLPSGCSQGSAPFLICTSSQVGLSNITVQTRDAVGAMAFVQFLVHLVPSLLGLPQESGFAVLAATGAFAVAVLWIRTKRPPHE